MSRSIFLKAIVASACDLRCLPRLLPSDWAGNLSPRVAAPFYNYLERIPEISLSLRGKRADDDKAAAAVGAWKRPTAICVSVLAWRRPPSEEICRIKQQSNDGKEHLKRRALLADVAAQGCATSARARDLLWRCIEAGGIIHDGELL